MSRLRPILLSGPCAAVLALAVVVVAPPSSAAQSQVGLGTATPFAVLGGSGVTNTGPTTISGDVGVAPNNAITGFPPGLVSNGTMHAADAVASQAQDDLTTAYNDAAGRSPAADETGQDLGGQTLLPGVYQASTAMALTGTVTLDAKGDPAAIFIFQAGSTLNAASSSTVSLTGAAQACNVFWQVGSSATIGTTSKFVGTIIALTSITMQTNATLQGRALARNGAVTLDSNTINRPTCAAAPPTDTASPNPSTSVSPTPSISTSASPSPTVSTATPTGTGGTNNPGSGATTNGTGGNGGGSGGGGNGGGGNSGGGGNGGGGNGGGSGSGGGASSTSALPTIPAGHPETGTRPVEKHRSGLWLVVALLCLGSAGGAAAQGSRRRASLLRS